MKKKPVPCPRLTYRVNLHGASELVKMDTEGPPVQSQQGNKYILVVHAFTRYAAYAAMIGTTSEIVSGIVPYDNFFFFYTMDFPSDLLQATARMLHLALRRQCSSDLNIYKDVAPCHPHSPRAT